MTLKHATGRSRIPLVLVAGALVAWAVTVQRMRGMDAGPGTDLGGLGWYLGIWVAASPGTVPGLTDPMGSPPMQMGS